MPQASLFLTQYWRPISVRRMPRSKLNRTITEIYSDDQDDDRRTHHHNHDQEHYRQQQPQQQHHHHPHPHHQQLDQEFECVSGTLRRSSPSAPGRIVLCANTIIHKLICESHKLLSYLALLKWMCSTQSISKLRLEPSTMLATGRKHFFCMLAGLLLLIGAISAHGLAWQRTGCHLLGHTQRVKISGCVEFEITTNACRGYCLSYSIPARDNDPARVPTQLVTSVAQCCSMIKSEEIKVRVLCIDGSRELRFRSATECSCSHCQKY